MLVSGGRVQGNESLNSAEIYDPLANTWNVVAPMHTERFKHTATLLANGRVLVTGGWLTGDIPTTSAEVYDPALNTWTVVASLNAARSYHTATLLLDGRVLVAGGYDGSSINSAEVYDPDGDTWTSVTSMNTPRQFHTATLLPDGKVMVAGGSTAPVSGAETSSVEVYDPAFNTWTTIAPMTSVHFIHTATLLLNGKVLVTGGWNGYNTLANVDIYDPGLGYDDDWPPVISSMPSALLTGKPLTFTGTGFRGFGLAEASNGCTYSSPTNYPLVQLRRLDNEQVQWLRPASFNSTSYTSLPITDMQRGPVLVTVFVNGIPGVSKLLLLRDYYRLYLPLVIR